MSAVPTAALSATTSNSILDQQLLPADSESTTSSTSSIIIRELRLADIPVLAEQATRAYWDSPVNNLICPGAPDYPRDLIRIHRQSIRRLYVNPRALSLTACLSSDPETPVAHAQFVRQGNDQFAKEFIKGQGILWRVWIFALAWWFWAYNWVDNFVWKDRATDFLALKQFGEWIEIDNARYWKAFPERQNRWHARSVIVDPMHHGKGIGKRLMRSVMDRAQKERVIMGLSASPHGEFLYKKLGFEMLGDFHQRILPKNYDGGYVGGGIMIWYPEGWEGPRHKYQ